MTIHDSTFWNNHVGAAPVGGALNNAGTLVVTDSIVGNPGDSAGLQECYSDNTVNGPGCPSNGDANGNITAPATFNLGAARLQRRGLLRPWCLSQAARPFAAAPAQAR